MPLPARSIVAAAAPLIVTVLIVLLSLAEEMRAQGKPGSGASSPSAGASASASQSGGSSGLQGISFARESWDTRLVLQDPKILGLRNSKDMVVVCYRLVPGNSATQPFLLEPDPVPSPWGPKHPYKVGDVVAPTKPNGHFYQAQIAVASGTTPPRFRTDGMTLAADGLHLYWRDMGSTSPAQQPVLSPWEAKRPYTADAEVLAVPPNGHFYQAKIGIRSGRATPAFPTDATTLAQDSPGLTWRDMGTGNAIFVATLPQWQPNHPYSDGDQIQAAPPNGHFYQSQVDFGSRRAGPTEPDWNVREGGSTPDTGGQLSWKDLGIGISNPNIPANCRNVSPSQPLLMDQILVVAIDMTAIPRETRSRFRLLNLNITNQQGQSLNPTPLRPSLAAGTASGAETAALLIGEATPTKSYFLTWPNQLPGDTIPTVSVNLTYTPVAPALPWAANTFYPAGSIVVPSDAANQNGHYYLAVNSGVSGDQPPEFGNYVVRVPTFTEGSGLSWRDMGLTPPASIPAAWVPGRMYATGDLVIPPFLRANGHYYRALTSGPAGTAVPQFSTDGTTFGDDANITWKDMGPATLSPPPPVWTANNAYATGAQVLPSPANGHYYQAVTSGVTGPNAPPFPVNGTTVPESAGITYIDAGTTQPTGSKLKAWAPNTAFFLSDAIEDPTTGHYYSVVQPGISGAAAPAFAVPAPKTVPGGTNAQPIVWQDFGTTLPASVSAGSPPADQTVNLLTYTYPQAHALSRFNLASGVVVSWNKSQGFTNLNPSTAATPNWTSTKNGLTVDPILAVSAYIKAIDAERRFHWSDLTPAPTIGFSLSSPTTNFYVGASSELFIRNLQVIYGLSINKISVLQPPANQTSATTPATRQVFMKAGFVGVTFNITGFIQSLFIPH